MHSSSCGKIHLFWQDTDIWVYITHATLNLFMLRHEIINIQQNVVETTVSLQHLLAPTIAAHKFALLIVARLANILHNMQFIAFIPDISNIDTLDTSCTININGTSYQLLIQAANAQDIALICECANLCLPRFLNKNVFSWKFSAAKHQYTINCSSSIYTADSVDEQLYLRCSLHSHQNTISIYISRACLSAIYSAHIGTLALEFKMQPFYLETIVTLINILLAKFATTATSVVDWCVSKLPSRDYIETFVNIDDFNTVVLVPVAVYHVWQQLLVEHDSLFSTTVSMLPELAFPPNTLINLSLVTLYIDANITDITQLRSGDVLLSHHLLAEYQRDDYEIDLGSQQFVLTPINNGKQLVIRDVYCI